MYLSWSHSLFMHEVCRLDERYCCASSMILYVLIWHCKLAGNSSVSSSLQPLFPHLWWMILTPVWLGTVLQDRGSFPCGGIPLSRTSRSHSHLPWEGMSYWRGSQGWGYEENWDEEEDEGPCFALLFEGWGTDGAREEICLPINTFWPAPSCWKFYRGKLCFFSLHMPTSAIP